MPSLRPPTLCVKRVIAHDFLRVSCLVETSPVVDTERGFGQRGCKQEAYGVTSCNTTRRSIDGDEVASYVLHGLGICHPDPARRLFRLA
jgi:hypothetical protein